MIKPPSPSEVTDLIPINMPPHIDDLGIQFAGTSRALWEAEIGRVTMAGGVIQVAGVPSLNLTESEQRIMAVAGTGLGNDDIARSIYRSVDTVKTNVRTAFAKLAIHNRSVLASRLIETAVYTVAEQGKSLSLDLTETDVLTHIAAGMEKRQMLSKLNMRDSMLGTHMAALAEKCGYTKREMIVFAGFVGNAIDNAEVIRLRTTSNI